MAKEHNDKILYLGMREQGNEFVHVYERLINNLFSRKYFFGAALFKKGGVGAVYDCTFKDDSVHYNKSNTPTYMLEVGPGRFTGTEILFKSEVQEATVKHEQAQVKKRNSKPNKEKTFYDIEDIRTVYKRLNGAAKSRFIADLVYKITK